jgi:tetratricopeptide (TPR) repeat protein
MEQVVSAAAFLQNGDYKQATLMAQKAMNKLKKSGNVTDLFQALEIRVNAMYATQDYDKAAEVLRSVLTEYKGSGEKKGEVLVTCLLADALLNKGETEAAMAKAEEAKELAKDQRDRSGEAVALRTLSKIHMRLNNLDEALNLGYRVSDIMEESKDYESQAFELTSLAELHQQAGQDNECIAAVRKAAKLFQKVPNRDGEAQALRIGAEASWASGVIRKSTWDSGDDEGALPMSTRALDLFRSLGNLDGQIAMATMQGQLLLQLNEFDEAYQVAIETSEMLPRVDSTAEQMVAT